MAYTDEVKNRFPWLFSDFEKNWPISLGGSFMPLLVEECNARSMVPFPRATVCVKGVSENIASPASGHDEMLLLKAIPEVCLYSGVITDMMRSVRGSDNVLECLGKFFLSDQHFTCLKALLTEKKLCEAQVQSILALHLFKPLMPECTMKVDIDSYQRRNIAKECPVCKKGVPTARTSFGNRKAWYGYGDILLGHSIVKIVTEEEEFETEATEEYSVDLESGEPCTKTPKLERIGSGEADMDQAERNLICTVKLCSGDRYMPDGPKNISFIYGKENKTLSQILAQTIANAFLQVKLNPLLKDCFIPSFLASEKHVTIHMYNPTKDILLTQTRTMHLWQNEKLNSETVLNIWFALNMLRFTKCPTELSIQSSNFHFLVGPTLELYQNELKSPLEDPVPDNTENSFSYQELYLHWNSYLFKERERIKKEDK